MPSSKGKPTDPELREELKDGKLNLTLYSSIRARYRLTSDRDQAGAKQERRRRRTMVCLEGKAHPATKLAKEYEKQGGGYENEPGSKNEPKGGKPEAKSEAKKKKEKDS
ncbi:hypothetical protein VP1G_10597 [Cytospora mali]|uniref:Uncharacterized protein n=1 Tax=Cytospora mali TaxID=578113 RepID=A0A194UPP0_CYTMA|nr:hypothetical protein VP1G_10597 [Valsa mali var. pyri (nom. inval.)]